MKTIKILMIGFVILLALGQANAQIHLPPHPPPPHINLHLRRPPAPNFHRPPAPPAPRFRSSGRRSVVVRHRHVYHRRVVAPRHH